MKYTIHPEDTGIDAKALGMKIIVEPDTTELEIESKGERQTIDGTKSQIVKKLQALGYKAKVKPSCPA